MAWSGWWHNQIGLLTEVASARIAAPVDAAARAGRPRQRPAAPEPATAAANAFTTARRSPPPTDITPRTEYPRPWLGGRWTLRDIVDYELIATMALLETAADRRETLLRQIYEVNRQTVEDGKTGDAGGDPHPGRAAARRARGRAPGRRAARSAASRSIAPTRRSRRTATHYAAGTFVIPMTQVFARYAKDLLEKQTYPEVRRAPERAARAAVRRHRVVARHAARRRRAVFVKNAAARALKMTRVDGLAEACRAAWRAAARGSRSTTTAPDTAIAINRLLKDGAQRRVRRPRRRSRSTGVAREPDRRASAKEFGLDVRRRGSRRRRPRDRSREPPRDVASARRAIGDVLSRGPAATSTKAGRAGCSSSTSSTSPSIHNADIRDGELRQQFDAIILPDQTPREIVDGFDAPTIRPEYRGGIGEAGVEQPRAVRRRRRHARSRWAPPPTW